MSRLLSLPRELRDCIYDYALSDLHNAPPKEYTIFKSDFSAYLALRLVNTQVAAETKHIFISQYAPDLTIHTNSVPRLYDFLAASRSHIPGLSAANFRLSMSATSSPETRQNVGWQAELACLITVQERGSQPQSQRFRATQSHVYRSLGWQHIRAVIRSGGCRNIVDDREKDVSPVFGDGLRYTHYSKNHVTKTEGPVVVVEGRLGALIMDMEENIKWMRSRTPEGPMTESQWLRLKEILRMADERPRE